MSDSTIIVPTDGALAPAEFTPRYPLAYPSLPLQLVHQGKTRDTYATNRPGYLLIVASDRMSTHNVVHKSLFPDKGQVLTALTIFWSGHLYRHGITTHVTAYGKTIYDFLPGKKSDYPADLHTRAIVVRKLTIDPIEYIFRAYMSGSLYRDFYSKGEPNPYGLEFPIGLPLMHEFGELVFTPTEKSETDPPLQSAVVMGKYPKSYKVARRVYDIACVHAKRCGITIIDFKGEIGVDGRHPNEVCVGDEIVTPDCARFCESSEIKLGRDPKWLDKQIVREEAERIWGGKKGPPLEFGNGIIEQTSDTYRRVFERLSGKTLTRFQEDMEPGATCV